MNCILPYRLSVFAEPMTGPWIILQAIKVSLSKTEVYLYLLLLAIGTLSLLEIHSLEASDVLSPP